MCGAYLLVHTYFLDTHTVVHSGFLYLSLFSRSLWTLSPTL